MISRHLFEEDVNQLAQALQQVSSIQERKECAVAILPKEYFQGARPTPPTSDRNILDVTEFRVSTIHVAFLDCNHETLTNIEGLTAIQEHQTPKACARPKESNGKGAGTSSTWDRLAWPQGTPPPESHTSTTPTSS